MDSASLEESQLNLDVAIKNREFYLSKLPSSPSALSTIQAYDKIIEERLQEINFFKQAAEMSKVADNVNIIPTITTNKNINPLLIIGGLILGAVLITR